MSVNGEGPHTQPKSDNLQQDFDEHHTSHSQVPTNEVGVELKVDDNEEFWPKNK